MVLLEKIFYHIGQRLRIDTSKNTMRHCYDVHIYKSISPIQYIFQCLESDTVRNLLVVNIIWCFAFFMANVGDLQTHQLIVNASSNFIS